MPFSQGPITCSASSMPVFFRLENICTVICSPKPASAARVSRTVLFCSWRVSLSDLVNRQWIGPVSYTHLDVYKRQPSFR